MSNISTYTEYGQLGTMDTEKIENLKTAAEGGGGGGVFVCSVWYNGTNASNTFEEILAAHNEGKIVELIVYTMPPQYGYQAEVCYLSKAYTAQAKTIYFSQPCMYQDSTSVTYYYVTVTDSDEWTVENKAINSYA